jgi:hypothetical protein
MNRLTSFKHYEKNSPLVKSGLLGPVQLLTQLTETNK